MFLVIDLGPHQSERDCKLLGTIACERERSSVHDLYKFG